MSKFESFPIVKAFRENLAEIGINKSISAICGVSGGVDSMALILIARWLTVTISFVAKNLIKI
jgi:predicted PP-loop superfamily ATPase